MSQVCEKPQKGATTNAWSPNEKSRTVKRHEHSASLVEDDIV